MPILEFKCPLGHITEKILSVGDTTTIILCEYYGVTECCGPECNPNDPTHLCRLEAARVDIPSRSSFRLMPGGAGGFYKSSKL